MLFDDCVITSEEDIITVPTHSSQGTRKLHFLDLGKYFFWTENIY